MKGLNAQDQKDLEDIAKFKDKMSTNKKSSRMSKLTATKPQEFRFATDNRIRSQTSVLPDTKVEFTKLLRSSSSTNSDAPKGTTKPQPFNFTELHKKKPHESSEFISIAELNMKFHTQTPVRFRSKPTKPGMLIRLVHLKV